MPFIPHTPESLLQRSDSKNPGTTCKGITSAGRPCRRDIRSSPQSSPTGNRKSKSGVIAVLQPQDQDHEGAAAYFCFQHKDQAETLAGGSQDGRQTNIVPVQQRTSIDTLVDRTGVLDMEDEIPSNGRHKRAHAGTHKRAHARPARKETLPRKWQDIDGPLIAISGEKQSPAGAQRRQAKGQTNISFSLFCCTNSADRDGLPPPRVQRHSEKPEHPHASVKMPFSMQQTERPGHSRNPRLPVGQASGSPRPSQVMQERNSTFPSRPSAQHRSSHTQDLLTLMPTTLSPQTTSLLLAELAKPVSPHDEEGYIYMFWLTDDTIAAPNVQAASSLLSHGASSTTNGRKSDISAQSLNKTAPTKSKTMLLKIGRASNVQRRMNEWNRQCGYKLSLVRFYPYLSSSPLPSRNTSSPPASPSAPQKVPHAHRVERLIHLELTERRVKRDCESCGKEHREWFEVESSRNGLRGVDEVIRRWTEWGMKAVD